MQGLEYKNIHLYILQDVKEFMHTDYTKKAVHGAIVVFVMSILASGFGYILRLMLAKNLIPSEFGLVYAVIACFGLIYIFQHLGLNEALTWFIATHRLREQYSRIKSAIVFVVCFQTFTAIILGLVLIVSADWFAVHYFGNSLAANLVLIHAILLVLLPFETVFQSIFQGFHFMHLYSGVNLVRVLVTLVATYGFLSVGFGVLSVFYGYLVAALVPFVVWFPLFLRRIMPQYSNLAYTVDKKLVSDLFSFGVPVIFTSVAGIVMTYTDTIMLTGYRSLEEVGLYNAAVPTASLLWVIASSLTIVTFPITTELWEKKQHAQLRAGIELLYKYAIIFIIPFALTLYIYPDLILRTLFGEAYMPAAVVLQVLSFGAVLYTIGKVNDAIFLGIGKPRISSRIAITGAVFNIVGNAVLIPSYGMFGAAISTVAGFLVMLISGLYSIRGVVLFRIPWQEWFSTLVSAGFFLGVVEYTKTLFDLPVLLEAVLCLVLGFAAYLIGLILLRAVSIAEVRSILARI